jgi:glycerophosphoryl diester phosphodiesterase
MTDASRRDFLLLAGVAGAGLLLAETPGSAIAAANPGSSLAAETGRTKVAAMLADAPSSGGFDILPLVSSGDNIPLLTGTWPDLQPHAELTYGITGAPDGMGLMAVGDHYYIWLHHELVGDKSDDDYTETKFSNTIAGMVPGARLSLLKLTKDWRVVGGTQLIREFKPTLYLAANDGATPRVAAGSMLTLDLEKRTVAHAGHVPSDFCGGTLMETGFVNPATGKEEPVWFANEENGGYSGIAWACFPDGVAYPLEGLGVYEKETTLALRSYTPKSHGLTILVSSEDDDDGEIYLWVGKPADGDPNGFVTGQLYALKIAGASRESGPGKLDGTPDDQPSVPADGDSVVGKEGDSKNCSWVAVPKEARKTGKSLDEFLSGEDANKGRRATAFLAPEDINEDAVVANRLWLAADGGVGTKIYGGDKPHPRYENPLSRLYRIDLGVKQPADPTTWSTTIALAKEGGEGKGVSYDNLAPDSNGKVLIAEDWDQSSDEADAVWEVLKKEQRAPALYLFDSKSGEIKLAFVTEMGKHDPELDWKALNALIASGADGEKKARDDSAFWETSGMIEVPAENKNGRAAYLITVQAHSLKTDGYGEGGQVLLCRPKGA